MSRAEIARAHFRRAAMHLSFGNVVKAQRHLDRGLRFGEYSELERQAFGLFLIGNKCALITNGLWNHYKKDVADHKIQQMLINWTKAIDLPDPIFPEKILNDPEFNPSLYTEQAIKKYVDDYLTHSKTAKPIQKFLEPARAAMRGTKRLYPAPGMDGSKPAEGLQPPKKPALFTPQWAPPRHQWAPPQQQWAPPPPPQPTQRQSVPPPPQPERKPKEQEAIDAAYKELESDGLIPKNRDEAVRNYKKLSLKHHPDKGGNEEEFKRIGAARDFLQSQNAMFGTSSKYRSGRCSTRGRS
jgi:hypothetical protein